MDEVCYSPEQRARRKMSTSFSRWFVVDPTAMCSHAMQYAHGRHGSRVRVFGVTCMINLRSPITTGAHSRSMPSCTTNAGLRALSVTSPFTLTPEALSALVFDRVGLNHIQ